MDVINNVTTALLEYYPLTLTVLLECVGILCQFGKPDWFLETCETSIELCLYGKIVQNHIIMHFIVFPFVFKGIYNIDVCIFTNS